MGKSSVSTLRNGTGRVPRGSRISDSLLRVPRERAKAIESSARVPVCAGVFSGYVAKWSSSEGLVGYSRFTGRGYRSLLTMCASNKLLLSRPRAASVLLVRAQYRFWKDNNRPQWHALCCESV